MRRKYNHNTAGAASYGEMEIFQWIEHEQRFFRKDMLAQAKQYNDMVRFEYEICAIRREHSRSVRHKLATK